MTQVETYHGMTMQIQETLQSVLSVHRVPEQGNPLLDIGVYALSARGKMLRGTLLLKACTAVGGNVEQSIYAAAGTEYGHLASLIHDDIIDRDELRRGQPTIWSAYGSDRALLTGDLFIFEAYYCLSLCRHFVDAARVARVLEVLSLSCIELCLGQAYEEQLSGKSTTTVEDYIAMISQKTGSLFRAALESGAVLGGGSEEQILAMRAYGDQLGIAFQIVDDILPYKVSEGVLLKPTQSDIKNKRMTLPILYAYADGSSTDRELLKAILQDDLLADDVVQAKRIVKEILERSGALQRAQEEALAYQRRAIEQLYCLPENEGKDFLLMVSEMAVNRER
jgi:geranylgeranyl pyrophosphate synthase